MESGIAAPTPGMVPSFRAKPGGNGPGVVGPSGTGKLAFVRLTKAGFCSPKPVKKRRHKIK